MTSAGQSVSGLSGTAVSSINLSSGVIVGIRSLLVRAARPAAMVGIVGMLSLSMVITTPSNAQALVKPPVPPGRILGALRTWAPKIATTIFEVGTSFTPVGWGLKAAVGLGMLAWSTSDIWMPYVTGAFGSGTNDGAPDPQGRTVQYVTNLKINSGVKSAATTKGERYVWSVLYTGGSTISKSYTVVYQLTCRTSSGATSTTGAEASGGVTVNANTASFTTQCPNVGDTIVGIVMGARNSAPEFSTSNSLPGPENVWRDGAGKTDSFDPRSPSVKYQGSAECIDAAGNLTWITGDLIGGDVGAVLMPSCEGRGKGHGTGRTKVTGFKPDGTPVPLWDVPTAPSDPDTPLCNPGRSTSGCVLEVIKDGQPCTPGDVECENWVEQNNADPNKDTSTSRFKCRFGPYTLPMSMCSMLEKAYRPGGAPATDANTDGDPSTGSDLDPNGNPITAPAPGVTGTGTGTNQAPAPGAAGQTGPSADQQSKDCFPSGWAALNPVEWVLKPVGCALTAAFVPKGATMTQLQTSVQTDIDHVGFSGMQAAVVSVFSPIASGSGCQGPPITFAMDGQSQTIYPFAACTAPMSIAAGICNALFTMAFIVGGGLALLRAVGSAFGYQFSFGRGAGASE